MLLLQCYIVINQIFVHTKFLNKTVMSSLNYGIFKPRIYSKTRKKTRIAPVLRDFSAHGDNTIFARVTADGGSLLIKFIF